MNDRQYVGSEAYEMRLEAIKQAQPSCGRCGKSVQWVADEIDATIDIRILTIIMGCSTCNDRQLMRYVLTHSHGIE